MSMISKMILTHDKDHQNSFHAYGQEWTL